MTDHYTEANRLIDGLHNLEGHNADFDMALAQVYATLALENQQRISNLIALEEKTHYTECDACNTPYPDWYAQPSRIRPEIARALRIETP